MFLSRSAKALIALGGAAVSWFVTDDSAAYSSTDRARILYVGDSIAAETRDTVAWWVQLSGKATVTSSIFPGMAICDFLDGKPAGMAAADKLAARVRRDKPHMVILQFWGNVFTPCINHVRVGSQAYYHQYFWDALNAVQQIEGAARDVNIPRPRILWVLQGPDKGSTTRTKRLNDHYSFVAGNFGDLTSDAGESVSMAAYPYPNAAKDRYAWTEFLPCSSLEIGTPYCFNDPNFGPLARLHKSNDAVHFCIGTSSDFGLTCDKHSPGILRYGMRIAHDASVWLGL